MKFQMTNVKCQMKACLDSARHVLFKIIIPSFVIFNLSFVISSAEAMSKATGDGQTQGVYIGVFREGAPRNMNHIKKYTEQTGKKPAMIMWYQDWAQDFPLDGATKVIEYGALPHIVWEPWYWSDHGKVKQKDIISGKWDNYIRSWARAIKSFGHPVFLRMAHEFNIGGYPWGVVNNGKNPKIYVKAYRHVVDIFKREKVDNVKWIWSFMNYSFPDEAWNDWAAAYPGDKYVDWIGIDGYNWGATQSWSEWQAFKYLFRDQVRRSKILWPDKPVMIAEFASAQKGGDKAAWIKEIPGYLKSSMRDIDAILWFDLSKETDWRIKSSKESLKAYQHIMKDPIFLSSSEGLAALVVSPPRILKKKKKHAIALKAPGSVVIDGKLSDWNKKSPVSMKDISCLKEGVFWKGPSDLSGTAYLMWDDTYLYLAAVINDEIPLVNKKTRQNIWNGDAIEMLLGLKAAADPNRTSFTSGDYQIGFGTGDGKNYEPTIWNWQRRRVPKGSEIVVKKRDKPQGYVLEAKIPWEFFSRGKFTPGRGAKVAFDIAFDDADSSGNRERQFIWNGDFDFYKDPSVWGILEFK